MKLIKHEDLEVYQLAFKAAMTIYEVSASFPKEERYSLTDQIRRSSRSICANIAEAFYKRKYPNYFQSQLTIAIAECGEIRVWLDFSKNCNYLNCEIYERLINDYGKIIGKLITMLNQLDKWQL
jgi:four helix bundle protein